MLLEKPLRAYRLFIKEAVIEVPLNLPCPGFSSDLPSIRSPDRFRRFTVFERDPLDIFA